MYISNSKGRFREDGPTKERPFSKISYGQHTDVAFILCKDIITLLFSSHHNFIISWIQNILFRNLSTFSKVKIFNRNYNIQLVRNVYGHSTLTIAFL
jgi:hypothetical protein